MIIAVWIKSRSPLIKTFCHPRNWSHLWLLNSYHPQLTQQHHRPSGPTLPQSYSCQTAPVTLLACSCLVTKGIPPMNFVKYGRFVPYERKLNNTRARFQMATPRVEDKRNGCSEVGRQPEKRREGQGESRKRGGRRGSGVMTAD